MYNSTLTTYVKHDSREVYCWNLDTINTKQVISLKVKTFHLRPRFGS